MSRIKVSPDIPTSDTVTDRIQKNITSTLKAIVASPVLDSTYVTIALSPTAAAQTVTFTHNLGRPMVGAHIISSNTQITSSGNQQSLSTTQGSIQVTAPNAVQGSTITLAVS